MNREDSFGFACSNNNSRNPYLEKEQEFKRINEELERKSSDLFDRIEQFSKTHRLRLSERSNKDKSNFGKSKSLYGGGGSGDSLPLSEEDEPGTRSTRSGYDYYAPSLHSDAEGGGGPHISRNKSASNIRSSSRSSGMRQAGRLQQATESVLKSLQAKLVNHEERLADLQLQFRQKIQENTILEGRAKTLEEERDKLFKTISSLQGTVEKHAKNAKTSKSNLNVKEGAVGGLKKEIEELKREQRAQNSQVHSFQSRLHRALEENERLKTQNNCLAQQLRDVNGESRQKLDAQAHRINELEREKAALSSTLYKQIQTVEKMKKQFGSRGRNGSGGHRSQGRDPDDTASCFSS